MRAPSIFMFGAGTIAGAAIVVVLMQSPVLAGRLSARIGPSPSPTAIPTPFPDAWEKIAADASLSTVAIQSFQGGALVRSGSGIILSSDGLVATTADVVPVGMSAYQVVFDDKVARGVVIARATAANLALIRVDASGLTVSALDRIDRPASGREFIITGKLVTLTGPAAFTQKALVNYTAGKTTVLDTARNTFISGGKIVNATGRVAGMAALRDGKVLMIPASDIDDFFKRSLVK